MIYHYNIQDTLLLKTYYIFQYSFVPKMFAYDRIKMKQDSVPCKTFMSI